MAKDVSNKYNRKGLEFRIYIFFKNLVITKKKTIKFRKTGRIINKHFTNGKIQKAENFEKVLNLLCK